MEEIKNKFPNLCLYCGKCYIKKKLFCDKNCKYKFLSDEYTKHPINKNK
jgi:hypothetical protein